MTSEVLTHHEVRDNLVTTAVKFLSNPSVQRCTMESKERFLRAKGLTELEIQKAVERWGEIDMSSLTSELRMLQHSWGFNFWFKEKVLPLIVYGGFAYGCYWFYKNCIKQILFVEQPKRKTTAECIEELRKSLDVANASISSLRSEIQTGVQQNALRSQIDGLKDEISTVKGILLNRNQFPSLKTRTEPPSIPAWQRQAEEATSTEAVQEKKPHRSRSQRTQSAGSNSSEGEQATKNSDSSLEIIT